MTESDQSWPINCELLEKTHQALRVPSLNSRSAVEQSYRYCFTRHFGGLSLAARWGLGLGWLHRLSPCTIQPDYIMVLYDLYGKGECKNTETYETWNSLLGEIWLLLETPTCQHHVASDDLPCVCKNRTVLDRPGGEHSMVSFLPPVVPLHALLRNSNNLSWVRAQKC